MEPSVLRVLAFGAVAASVVVQFATELPDRAGAIAEPLPADRPQNVTLKVQLELEQLGFDAGPVDGIAGSRTRQAIQAYRRWKGVPGDDHVTRDLLVLLNEGG